MSGVPAALLRQPLLAAGRSARLQHLAERSRLTRSVVRRYVAGSTEADAIRVSRELVGSDALVSLDFLGENTTSRAGAEQTINAYRSVLKELGRHGLASSVEVSVKLSALGQALPGIGEGLSTQGVFEICEVAADVGTTVTLDMEDHTTTDATLAALTTVRGQYPWLGAVIQAYLKRSEGDCRDLATTGSRVRLCKGAYAEPESVAYRGEQVLQSYRRCLSVLFQGAGYPMVATHDPAMLGHAAELVRAQERAADSFEYQLLFGVRPDAQRALIAAGHRVRVYTPYGDQWYGYFLRRLAERPENLALFLRSLASRR